MAMYIKHFYQVAGCYRYLLAIAIFLAELVQENILSTYLPTHVHDLLTKVAMYLCYQQS